MGLGTAAEDRVVVGELDLGLDEVDLAAEEGAGVFHAQRVLRAVRRRQGAVDRRPEEHRADRALIERAGAVDR